MRIKELIKKFTLLIILLSVACNLEARDIIVSKAEKKQLSGERAEEKKDIESQNKENEISDNIYSKVKSYLVESLTQDNLQPFESKHKIKIEEIKSLQERIWREWKEANNQKQEEKLANLQPLNKKNHFSWTLPEEKGKPAIMPFYYGSKGDIKEGKYPLFIYTHGSGEKSKEWSTGHIICSKFDDAPSAYFIPQIPNEGEYYRWWQKAKQFAWERLLRLSFVSGEIDPNRVYIIGISEGGYGSQRLASFYADYLAGAGPMAGGEPLVNAPVENCRNIAFSLRTGEEDRMFYRNKLSAYAKETFEKFKNNYPDGFNHFIEIIPKAGHFIDYSITTPWLKNFSRIAQPKKVMWEDFEMDGQRRKGFYNIQVIERPQTEGRTYYKMEIEGNVVNITAENVEYEPTETDKQWGIWLRFNKKYTPASSGKIKLYLSEKLVDLKKAVTVNVNGKRAFKGKIKPDIDSMVNSCAVFFDPERIFPASLVLDIK